MYNISEEKIMQNWKGDFCKPVVSVCCTTYNHENYIAETIDGFLMQKSDFPFEILIRDDCSTDRTAEIVKQYAEQYPQLIKPIYEKENTFSKGVAPMRQLFKIAKGEYLAPCEGDDYWTDPLKLQKQVDFLISNPLYSGCFHDCMIIHEGEKSNQEQRLRIGNRKIAEEVDLISIIDENNIALASIMFRNFIEETPKYRKETSKGDYALMVMIAEQGKIKYLPEVMSTYRIHDGGVWSSRSPIYKEKENIKFYTLLQEHFADNKYILKALSRKKKYSLYSLSLMLVREKQRLKSLYYLMLSLDLPNLVKQHRRYLYYFKEFVKSIVSGIYQDRSA